MPTHLATRRNRPDPGCPPETPARLSFFIGNFRSPALPQSSYNRVMPERFQLFAQPWWVNFLLLVPIVAGLHWRRHRLQLAPLQLICAGVFAAGFGFVEAAVVIYLRAAVGLLVGYQSTLAEVRRAAAAYQFVPVLSEFPRSLFTVELFREAATIVMLGAVAGLAARRLRERWAVFLWCFAIWDATYYAGLWATIRWPLSLTSSDVLFLIPVPWIAQVWFPLLVCMLTVAAIIVGREPVARGLARGAAAD